MTPKHEESRITISVFFPDPENREQFNLKIESLSQYTPLKPFEAAAALGRAIAIIDRKSSEKPGNIILRAKEEIDDSFVDPNYEIRQTISRPVEKKSFTERFKGLFGK